MKRSALRGLLIAAATALLLCVFPGKARADGAAETLELYYYVDTGAGEPAFETTVLTLCGTFTAEQKALILFENLLDPVAGEPLFIPEGTVLLSVTIDGNRLVLNVSDDICRYGGTAYERALVRQLALNALNLDNVSRVTLMIQGAYAPLPEGTLLFETPISDILAW